MNHALATTTTHTPSSMIMDPTSLGHLQTFAQVMATGRVTVPKHFQNSEGDCLAVALQAVQWGMNPFAVAQKTHIVNGNLGYEAQLVNAVISTMAPTKDRINYKWDGEGENLTCTVSATIKGEDSPRELTIGIKSATVRNSPLWKSDPKQQLAYLAVKRWARLHCPDVILGVYTADELQELPADPVEKDMGKVSVAEKLKAQRESEQPEVAEQQPVEGAQPENPSLTYAQITDQMNKAKTIEELNDIKDDIRAFVEPQLSELKIAFSSRKAALINQQAQ